MIECLTNVQLDVDNLKYRRNIEKQKIIVYGRRNYCPYTSHDIQEPDVGFFRQSECSVSFGYGFSSHLYYVPGIAK